MTQDSRGIPNPGEDLLRYIREAVLAERRGLARDTAESAEQHQERVKVKVVHHLKLISRDFQELIRLYVSQVLYDVASGGSYRAQPGGLGQDGGASGNSHSPSRAQEGSPETSLSWKEKLRAESLGVTAAQFGPVVRSAGAVAPPGVPGKGAGLSSASSPEQAASGRPDAGATSATSTTIFPAPVAFDRAGSGVSGDAAETASASDRSPTPSPKIHQKPLSTPAQASALTRRETYSCKPGKVRVAFREVLPEWVSRMRERTVEGLPAGIELAANGEVVEGAPLAHGEFKFIVKGRTEDGRWIELTVHLPILPDPRDLWKDVPSDPHGRFAKPDRDGEAVRYAQLGISLLAASVRGRSHAQKGTYRDDDFYIQRFASGWIVIATADGAGSAEFSRRGSMVAVKTAAIEFERMLQEGEAQLKTTSGDSESMRSYVAACAFSAANKAVDAIDAESARESVPVSKFSTTLILVALRQIGNRWLVASFGVGDGGAAVWDDARSLVIPLTKGDSGEFAGQTKFLRRAEVETPELVRERSAAVLVDRPTAILAMTDGITDPKFETDALLHSVDHWRSFWRNDLGVALARGDAESLKERLLVWMDFWSPGNHDDRTLAAVLFDEVK